jgi:hypothetical protein
MTEQAAPPEIRLVDLTKDFREVRAVDNVSLDIVPASSSRSSARLAVARRRRCG